MADSGITRAVVLAAGTGSRLADGSVPLPKPLRPVAGVPLIIRVLRTLELAGIREAIIVVGFEADRIKRALVSEPSLGLRLSFVENPEFNKKNGMSLLAAAPYVDRECLLTMSDHLYSPDLVRRLVSHELPEDACALAVDYDIEHCFDLDDATKVSVALGRISEIGKELADYTALDTGVFRIGPRLIRELRTLAERSGDCSLSEGVQKLSAHGLFHVCDVTDARWIDVDTPAALERAEAMIRVFGDALGDEPGAGVPPRIDPESIELFCPTWVRAAKPYNEDHFAVADRKRDVVRMMSNESPFPPSRRVVEAIVEAALRGNLYPGGATELRRRLGAREALGTDNVLLGAGSTELIDLIIRSFVSPGEEVLLSVPTFSMYEARTRVVGGIPILVPLTSEHEHDVGALIRAVTERTKVIFVCTPNNPTGNSIDLQSLKRILRLGLPTVIDEAYFEFGMATSASHLLAEFPNAMVLRTFSKAFGLAGLRLGYVLSHPVVTNLLARVKVPWTVPAIALAAATAVLDDSEEFAERRTELVAQRIELARHLDALPGLEVIPSEGNFLLVDISSTGVTADAFVALLLKDGVLIRSLDVHHADKSYVRVTVGDARQNARCEAAFKRALGRVMPQSVPAYVAVGSDAE